MTKEVILVDEKDKAVGAMEKLRAHQEGLLHRAFSIFVFNSQSHLLMHKRAKEKYHSGGLWTNTCCSHPAPGEEITDGAKKRLKEEMGMECEMRKSFEFVYRAEVSENLIEHEFDHVFIGNSDDTPVADPNEVSEWKWMSSDEINASIASHPENYTAWFHIAWPLVEQKIKAKE